MEFLNQGFTEMIKKLHTHFKSVVMGDRFVVLMNCILEVHWCPAIRTTDIEVDSLMDT